MEVVGEEGKVREGMVARDNQGNKAKAVLGLVRLTEAIERMSQDLHGTSFFI